MPDDPLAEFLAWVRPKWHADAACREHPEVNFYPERGEDIRRAYAVCSGCLARAECETAGIEGQESGAAAPAHGNGSGGASTYEMPPSGAGLPQPSEEVSERPWPVRVWRTADVASAQRTRATAAATVGAAPPSLAVEPATSTPMGSNRR